MGLLTLAVRDLARQGRRTLLTLLTFAAAAFIFTILVSIPASIDRILSETSRSLRVLSYNADGRYLGLPARYCGQIENIRGAAACTPLTYLRAIYRSEREIVQAYAIDSDRLAPTFPDYGLPPQVVEAFARDRTAALAGRLLKAAHHWHVGDIITLKGDSNRLNIRFLLVGEIPSANYPNYFIFRRDYLVESEKAIGISEQNHPAGLLATRVDSPADVPRIVREIDQRFHNSEFETATMTESDAMTGLMSSVGDIRGILRTVFAAIVLTVLLIAANSMALIVRERVSDVAVLRTLGFSSTYLALLLLVESGAIGALGGGAGSSMAFLCFRGETTLGGLLQNAGYLTITDTSAGQAFGTVLCLSLLSAVLPILGALRTRPAEALSRVS